MHNNTHTASILDVRLVNGSNQTEGRVEVNYNQEGWGTICDDQWGLPDADVVCKMLGYKSASRAPVQAFFGKGSGIVWMDDLYCLGNESSLLDCSYSGLKLHNCRHSEDAGVTCTGTSLVWCLRHCGASLSEWRKHGHDAWSSVGQA